MRITHHGANEASATKKITCHTCALTFSSKKELMRHRKVQHSDIIRKCRHFAEGGCEFEDDICWYRHTHDVDESRKQASTDNSFKCRFCEESFSEKSTFMFHRKKDHPRIVKQCRNFQAGNCYLSGDECWYKHL